MAFYPRRKLVDTVLLILVRFACHCRTWHAYPHSPAWKLASASAATAPSKSVSAVEDTRVDTPVMRSGSGAYADEAGARDALEKVRKIATMLEELIQPLLPLTIALKRAQQLVTRLHTLVILSCTTCQIGFFAVEISTPGQVFGVMRKLGCRLQNQITHGERLTQDLDYCTSKVDGLSR